MRFYDKASKHLEGQLDHPVCNITFWIKGGQLHPSVRNVTLFSNQTKSVEPALAKMQKKSCRYTEMQLQKSLDNVVQSILSHQLQV